MASFVFCLFKFLSSPFFLEHRISSRVICLEGGGGGGGGGMAVVVTSAQRLIRGEIDWIELINGRLIKFVFEREGKKCRSRC